MADLHALPEGLPEPLDDGACDHLPGLRLPSTSLPATTGERYDLSEASELVMYVYPRTGGPGINLPADWDLIPGARGCTPQSCAFRDASRSFQKLGFDLIGFSAQNSSEQAEFAGREHIRFPLVSDQDLTLGANLGLPTFEAGGLTLYKRATLVVREHTIEKVFYPIFPPDQNAHEVLSYPS